MLRIHVAGIDVDPKQSSAGMNLLDIIAAVVGIAIAAVILVPLFSAVIVGAITVAAIQIAVVVAIGGYLVGIPWSIWFRLRHGRWPEA